MNEKFKYAPGKPGFGSKGDRGEDGQQGISMYFTDINPVTNSGLINSRITDNETLWRTDSQTLPGGRVYVTGDLFIDEEGKTYEINAESNTFEYKLASLNMGGFFLPLGIPTYNGFERYFNSNSAPKFIIDNVYTMAGAINYTAAPENIFGISPKDFTRIEYTNIKPDSIQNAFTVYSSANPDGVVSEENNKALALVYNENESTFHLGNLDNTGNLRNTNLTFDVSLLRHTKEDGNSFGVNTPDGAVLTNHEINANSLFDTNFDSDPDSFIGVLATTDAVIQWNLNDFANDPDIYGDLYFYEYISSYNGQIYRLDASIVRPLIFTNITTTDGSVRISGLKDDGAYSYYMKLYKNGWSRNSQVKTLFKGEIEVTPLSLLNMPKEASTFSYYFDVSANGPWNVSMAMAGNWITNIDTSIVGSGDYDGSIGFALESNSGTIRTARMRVSVLGDVFQDVSISQLGATTIATFSLSDPLPIDLGSGDRLIHWQKVQSLAETNLPPDTSVNVVIHYEMYAKNANDSRSISVENSLLCTAPGKSPVSRIWSTTINSGADDENPPPGTLTLTNMSETNFPIEVTSTIYASADFGGTIYDFSTRVRITNIVVSHVSGSPIAAVITGPPTTLEGSYLDYPGPPEGGGGGPL